MKTLMFILILIPSVILAESTTSTGASLSSMGLILTLMVLFAFTRLFKTSEKKTAVKEAKVEKKEPSVEELILEKIADLPVLTENGATNIKLLSSNEKEDTYIILAKVDKTPELKVKKKSLLNKGLLILVIALIALFYIINK